MVEMTVDIGQVGHGYGTERDAQLRRAMPNPSYSVWRSFAKEKVDDFRIRLCCALDFVLSRIPLPSHPRPSGRRFEYTCINRSKLKLKAKMIIFSSAG
jgi:hypothetical protein